MKIAVLCHMGYGSSLILKMKVEEILKTHCLSAEVVALRREQEGMEAADLIFISPQFKEGLEKYRDKIIAVENFLDPVEVENEGVKRIRQMI